MNIKMNVPIADIHCDLLLYLCGDNNRTAYDPKVRCSIPQLREGNVVLQTLAIFAETAPHSEKLGWKQAEIFKNLPKNYSESFYFFKDQSQLNNSSIGILVAIENASALWGENELLEVGLERLNKIYHEMGRILYITMTWNTENRFGGGAHTQIGLKEDGKYLLKFLDNKNIPIDFSHTSDRLAYDILNFIDLNHLKIPIIASHSNFRSVKDVARNLPDEIAKEIFHRGGIIGLNFIRDFVGPEDPSYFVRQVEHGLKLGGENQLCFGADFFYDKDLSPIHQKLPEQLFFPDYGHAGTYPAVLEMWRNALKLDQQLLEKIAHQNFYNFIILLEVY